VQNTLVSSALLRYLLIPLVALWIYHLSQRRFDKVAQRKREGTLLLALLLILCWGLAWVFQRVGIPDVYLILVGAGAIAAAVWQRRRFFPYRLHCERCGNSLSINHILFRDSGLCQSCNVSNPEGEKT
jgi:hypothetical protein